MSVLKYINKYVKVFDKNHTVIASGLVVSEKPNFDIHYVSFDDRWFYGETENLRLIVVPYADTVVPEIPPLPLVWEYWKNNEKQKELTIDVYRDYSYDEIDVEIKPYIDRLNKIYENLATVTSCSGHGVTDWHIQFKFSDFISINIFLMVLSQFEDELSIRTNCNISYNPTCVHLHLRPEIDDSSFEVLGKFVKKLEIAFKTQL